MYKRFLIAAYLFSIAVGAPAYATPSTPVEIDGKEWLQPVDFIDLSWDFINDNWCSAETGVCSAGPVDGYRWASNSEIVSLFNSADYDPFDIYPDVVPLGATSDNLPVVDAILEEFNPTIVVNDIQILRTVSRSLCDTCIELAYRPEVFSNPSVDKPGRIFMNFTIPISLSGSGTGAWFFRDVSSTPEPPGSIPEPSVTALFALGLACLGYLRRRQRI